MSLLLPNVILFPLGFNSKLVAVNSFELNVNPPIVPLWAFNTPAVVTLKGAEEKVPWPNWIPSSASAIKIVLLTPNVSLLSLVSNEKSVAVNAVDDNSNPPINPPVNKTLEPVIWPFDFNLKFPLELETAFDVIANPPISPEVAVILPLIWASEAVIWPLDFKIKLLFELDIAVSVNPNEAIVPVPFTV